MDPYALTTHDGKTVDVLTHEALKECERRLGYQLSITQGCYQAYDGRANDVDASAGTHDGGGVVDLPANDWQEKLRVLRAVGFAAWHRPAVEGLWGEHIHAVLIGNRNLAPVAARQVVAYYAGRDGLKSNLIDPLPRPNPIPVFEWPPTYTRGADVDATIKSVRAAKRKARAALRDAKSTVRRARLRKALAGVRAALRALLAIEKRPVL